MGEAIGQMLPTAVGVAVSPLPIVRPASPFAQEVATWVLFVAIASIGVSAPVVISFALGELSGPLLDRLKNWMARNNSVIMAVLPLIIGVKLIGDAITGFST